MIHYTHYEKGWRLSVGIVLINKKKKIFMGERVDNQGSWQMPQGGVNISKNERLEDAARRELFEETGIKNAEIILTSKHWNYYYLPEFLSKKLWGGKFIGQKQKWFLFNFNGQENEINLVISKKPEFSKWKWVNPEIAMSEIVSFKKEVYNKVLKEFNLISKN